MAIKLSDYQREQDAAFAREVQAGGKPNKGTPKDKRLKRNNLVSKKTNKE